MTNAKTATQMRRASPIHGFVGPNGSGKSACMVETTLPSLDAGRRVLSTVRLFETWQDKRGEWHRGDQHPGFELLTDWAQLLDAEHCDVLMDEIVGIASARESQGMPVQVANLLTQLRRRDITLRWTAPAWARADKIIRECSQAVTDCRGYWSDTRSQKEAAEAGNEVRQWAPRRLFRWRTFSAVDFEDFTSGKRERLSPEVRQWKRGPGSRMFAAYDTLDAVARVGEVLDGGRCAHCGGRRPVPVCKCDDHGEKRSGAPMSQLTRRGRHSLPSVGTATVPVGMAAAQG